MKLVLNRTKKKGRFTRKMIFRVVACVDLTPEEEAALSGCRFGKEVLYQSETVGAPVPHTNGAWPGWGRGVQAATSISRITVDDLIGGKTVDCRSIMDALQSEKAAKSACQALSQLVLAAASFEGEAVHEF